MAFADTTWSSKTPIMGARPAHPCVVWFAVLIGAAVLHLYAACSPADITREIPFAVLDPIKGMVWRAFANRSENIGEKVGEVIPAAANLNASSTIKFITSNIWVIAPAAHGFPSPIQRVEVSLSGMAVSDVALNATAGTHLSTLETGSGCKFCVSAIATTLPHYIACAVSILGRMDGNESAKAYVCDICVSGHRSAPAVRGQVAGSALPTLTSPRTISPVVLGS